MSNTTAQSEFEAAFHKVAERHERVWVFIAMLLLSLLLIGTLFFVVLDYGVVVKTDGYNTNPATVGTTAPFADTALVPIVGPGRRVRCTCRRALRSPSTSLARMCFTDSRCLAPPST
jgi:hypothetical protein